MAESSPRFRHDLVASTAEEDGVAFVDVSDPGTGSNFRFYDYEYQLALQMDGQPVEQIVAWASATYGLDLTAEGVLEFGGRLAELGFLEARERVGAAHKAAHEAEAPRPEPPRLEPADAPGAAPTEALGSAEASWLALQHTRSSDLAGGARGSDLAGGARGSDLAGGARGSDLAGGARSYGFAGAAQDPNAPNTLDAVDPEDQLTPLPVAAPAPAPRPMAAAPTVPNVAPPVANEPSGLTEISPDELEEVSESGLSRSPAYDAAASLKTPGPTPPPTPAPAPRTPEMFPKTNGTEGRPGTDVALTDRAGAPRAPMAPMAGPLSQRAAAAPRASTPPVGMAERRQPPGPDRVVMTPFQDEVSRGRFTAPPPSRAVRRGPLVVGLLVVAIVAGAGAFYKLKLQHPAEPPAVRVHVVEPKPSAVYRWFSTAGTVVAPSAQPVAFEASGKLAEALPAGASFEAGETLAKLSTAAVLEAELGRHQSRVVYYEQLRDSMSAAGNQPELRQAELKLAEKKKLVEDTRTSLSKVMVHAPEPGEVLEASAKAGAQLAAKAPVLKWKGHLLHGEFTMDEQDFATAGKLGFCRVEVAAVPPAGPRFVDCKVPVAPFVDPNGRSSPLRTFVVTFPPGAGVAAAQSIRLAHMRYDGVFPVPASAVVHDVDGNKVWIVAPSGTAQQRPVTIAETREEALITKGLNVGDQVIAPAPPDLQEGARVAVER